MHISTYERSIIYDKDSRANWKEEGEKSPLQVHDRGPHSHGWSRARRLYSASQEDSGPYSASLESKAHQESDGPFCL
jgi:hypothetical protein